MSGLFGHDGRPKLLIATLKAVAAVVFLSVLTGHWLSESSRSGTSLSRLADQAGRLGREPAITGSVSRTANVVKLDPCNSPKP